MNTLFHDQQALLTRQVAVLKRLREALLFSAGRLSWPITAADLDDLQRAERLAALNDRFAKLQDQLAGAARHAHGMLGERYRTFSDVIVWMVQKEIITDPEQWLELRILRNHLTHDYELDSATAAGYLNAMHEQIPGLLTMVANFEKACQEEGLLLSADPQILGSD